MSLRGLTSVAALRATGRRMEPGRARQPEPEVMEKLIISDPTWRGGPLAPVSERSPDCPAVSDQRQGT